MARIWGNHPHMYPIEEPPVIIELSPKGLLKDDDTFALQYSDFCSLNQYLTSMQNSSLSSIVDETYDILKNRDEVTLEGKRYQFEEDDAKRELLSAIRSAGDRYHDLVNICNTLISTAPQLPPLLASIKQYASQATAQYGLLFDALVALKADPDSSPDAAKSIITQLDSQIGQLCSASGSVAGALSAFDNDARTKETELMNAFNTIGARAGPVTHHIDLDENRAANCTHNHGVPTQNLRDTISTLNAECRVALNSAERLQGGWLAVRDDLLAIDKVLDRPAMFTENKAILRIDRDRIIRQWTAVSAEVDKLTGTDDGKRVYGYTHPK